MSLSPDQCSTIAQVLPTLVIALVAERYFGLVGGGSDRDNKLEILNLAAFSFGLPIAEVLCIAGINNGLHQFGAVVTVWAVLGWLLAILMLGFLVRAMDEAGLRPVRDASGSQDGEPEGN